ncbi:hypothetical protein [Niastella populi]|nr:hypothetical protein [Niastella populi]
MLRYGMTVIKGSRDNPHFNGILNSAFIVIADMIADQLSADVDI